MTRPSLQRQLRNQWHIATRRVSLPHLLLDPDRRRAAQARGRLVSHLGVVTFERVVYDGVSVGRILGDLVSNMLIEKDATDADIVLTVECGGNLLTTIGGIRVLVQCGDANGSASKPVGDDDGEPADPVPRFPGDQEADAVIPDIPEVELPQFDLDKVAYINVGSLIDTRWWGRDGCPWLPRSPGACLRSRGSACSLALEGGAAPSSVQGSGSARDCP